MCEGEFAHKPGDTMAIHRKKRSFAAIGMLSVLWFVPGLFPGLFQTADMPVAEIAARFGVARSTLYRFLLKPAGVVVRLDLSPPSSRSVWIYTNAAPRPNPERHPDGIPYRGRPKPI
jgi:hypothetical protein